jgi:hypothetical protein
LVFDQIEGAQQHLLSHFARNEGYRQWVLKKTKNFELSDVESTAVETRLDEIETEDEQAITAFINHALSGILKHLLEDFLSYESVRKSSADVAFAPSSVRHFDAETRNNVHAVLKEAQDQFESDHIATAIWEVCLAAELIMRNALKMVHGAALKSKRAPGPKKGSTKLPKPLDKWPWGPIIQVCHHLGFIDDSLRDLSKGQLELRNKIAHRKPGLPEQTEADYTYAWIWLRRIDTSLDKKLQSMQNRES